MATLPSDISDLELWLDAEQDVYTDAGSTLATNNDSVQEWHDQSGNNYDATNSNSSTKPTYISSAVNGKPAIRFNEDFLSKDSGFGTFNQPNTVFVVWQSDGLASGESQSRPFDNAHSGGGTAGNLLFHTANDIRIFAGSSLLYSKSFPTSHIISTGVFNGSSSFVRENGTQENSGNPGTQNVQDSYTLGAENGSGNQDRFWLVGDIAEVIFYSRELNSTEIEQVECYLSSKYGISVPHTCESVKNPLFAFGGM